MDIDALRIELASGHPDTGAYSSDDAVAAVELNAVNRSIYTPIPSSELLGWSAAHSSGGRPRLLKMQEAKENHVSEQVQAAASAAVTMINRDGTTLDLNRVDRMMMVDGLVAGGVLSADDKTDLLSLGTESVSRAVEIGLGWVRPGDVTQARM